MEESRPKNIQYGLLIHAKCNNVVPLTFKLDFIQRKDTFNWYSEALILLHNFWLWCKPLVFHALEQVCCKCVFRYSRIFVLEDRLLTDSDSSHTVPVRIWCWCTACLSWQGLVSECP